MENTNINECGDKFIEKYSAGKWLKYASKTSYVFSPNRSEYTDEFIENFLNDTERGISEELKDWYNPKDEIIRRLTDWKKKIGYWMTSDLSETFISEIKNKKDLEEKSIYFNKLLEIQIEEVYRNPFQ